MRKVYEFIGGRKVFWGIIMAEIAVWVLFFAVDTRPEFGVAALWVLAPFGIGTAGVAIEDGLTKRNGAPDGT